ncbi:4a-hydroxytetrahydrobiopterin dehydratase [Williamsia sterculiae]|uniref:Putative pterin-4-alpha-carbinolamine dehydratase n=1 Tax=Williamsia sterculiae TaxID=1344003 RepID=A0A1N7FSC4_9NOCA|nr:4a-hydroxytetrahydrobiopterin dehydratase [Williamsia sterculiae]SIS03174.1 4a-hydroxytetrahydrobiopterin dehydratase [Williamsia sterculiae]
MATVLTPDEIDDALQTLNARGGPDWTLADDALHRTVSAESFPAALELVVAVGREAEDRDHHPDIDIRWRDVTFHLSTHSEGGVTSADVELAATIDGIAAQYAA